jgi:chemotaxis protein histidine kinase CheA
VELDLGILSGRVARAGGPERQYRAALHRCGPATLLLLHDDSRQQALQLELQQARARCETALAVLRAPPDGLRLFLGSAMASVHAIRATLRMPARTQEALREKLGRLRAEATSLAAEAAAIGLSPVEHSCHSLADFAAGLQAQATISGDELLPLAPRVDVIASTIGDSSRIEELRYEAPPAATEPQQQRVRRGAAWHEVSERRWNEFLRRRGEEIGTLARLAMTGAQDVPPQLRRHVDEVLQHLLKNSLDHGIETPEDRLAAGKSAAGRICVGFARGEHGTLKMTVHDDGRGFDLSRIGRAAVQSGLLSDESLAHREAGDLVGLIFKPTFSTEGLDDGKRQGLGMAYLRRKITRLGGQISVATKPGRYTLFTVELPEAAATDEGLSQAMP